MKQGSNRSCFLLQLDLWECFMSSASSLWHLSLSNSFLSLSQSTFFLSSLFFFFTPYEFQIASISSARPRVHVVVHGRALVSFPNFSSGFDLIAMASFELAAGFDLAPFRKNDVHSSPRPRCLGWDAKGCDALAFIKFGNNRSATIGQTRLLSNDCKMTRLQAD